MIYNKRKVAIKVLLPGASGVLGSIVGEPVDPMTSAFSLPLKAEDRSKLDGTGGMEPTADAGKEPGLLSD